MRFNPAHNHYLQVAAEGGLLVGVPVLVALICLAREGWRAVADDKSAMYWIRAGALCALAGGGGAERLGNGTHDARERHAGALAAAIAVHDPSPHARR